MKIMLQISILFALTLPIYSQDAKLGIESLKWISGCWQMNDNGKITTEKWSKATSNAILGVSQTIKDGKTLEFEFLRVVNNGHGMIYVAKPSNARDETAFMVKSITENEVIFENAKHDFPQRIIYRLQNKNSLFARIEGKNKDQEMGIDFPMRRVKCE